MNERYTEAKTPKAAQLSPQQKNKISDHIEPIIDWSDDKISEEQWVLAARTAVTFKRSKQAINATTHPWKGVFFEGLVLSANFKYFLGLIATDGHITTNNIALGLSANDSQILEDLARWCSTTPRIVRYFSQVKDSKAYEMARLNFAGKPVLRMVRDLLRVVGTDKTQALHPRDFLLTDPHFLRGIFDGDGSVCPAGEKGKSSHMLQITSAAKDGFLDPLLAKLETDLGIKCGRIALSGHSAIAYVAEFWAEEARSLAKYCYGPAFNDPDLLVLNRKGNNAKKIINAVSLRGRPIWMIRNGEKQLFLDYMSAARELHYIYGGPDAWPADENRPHKIAQDISALFTKPGKRGHKVFGASFEVPTLWEIAQELETSIEDLRRYNPHLVPDLDTRSAVRPMVSNHLSPLVIRNPKTGAEKLYLNCAEATHHPSLKHAGYGRDAVQNLKRRFKDVASGTWISWTLRATGANLDLRLPTIAETFDEIERRSLDCDPERVESKLLKRGYQL